MFEQLGRLHPLLIHLPIGILIFALMITILPAKQREVLSPALKLALLLTAISSLAASIAGYLLSRSGDYDAELVQKHQWLGIATTIFAIATLLIKPYKRQMVWVTVLVMTIASHMGGTITHGEGFLFSTGSGNEQESDSTASEMVQPADTAITVPGDTLTASTAAPRQVFMYRDQVTPILKAKCYSCHSAVKKKGGLRLDSESFIAKGGKNGSILTKGDPNNSVLFTHLVLPLEDEKHMPPKGKKQLSKQEIALIHRWIAKGAPYGPVEIPASGPTLATTPVPALVDSAPDEGDEEREDAAEAVTTESKKTTAKQADIPPADESTVSALRQQGIIIEPTIPGSNALTVNFVNVKKLDPAMFSSLNELRDQVTELKFTGQPVSDENLAALSTFRHLNKLQLDKTAITDKGLESLQKFPTLESLNLYGTEVTDGGVRNLTSCKSLKRVYLWQTGITEQGLKNIKLARPELKTEAGLSTLSKPDSTKKK
jgi:mono/diheme cytochrome c family protein